jgi:hypothetical protein
MPACAAGNGNQALKHGGIAAMNSERGRGDSLPAGILNPRVEFPMAIIDAAIKEVRLLTAKDEDDVIDHGFRGSAGRVREIGPGLPAVRRRVIDVDAREASRISAADGPHAAARNNHRKMITHTRQLGSGLPARSRREDQHKSGSPASSDNIKPAIVSHHAVSPSSLDHRRQGFPPIGARCQPPEIVPGRPILVTKVRAGYFGAAAGIEVLPERCCGEVMARGKQRWARCPLPSVGIVDLDPVLGVEEPRKTTKYVEALGLWAGWIRTGLRIGNGSGEFSSGRRRLRAQGPGGSGARLRRHGVEPYDGAGHSNEQQAEKGEQGAKHGQGIVSCASDGSGRLTSRLPVRFQRDLYLRCPTEPAHAAGRSVQAFADLGASCIRVRDVG